MKRDSSIRFRVNASERRRIEKRAADACATVAEYARVMILGEPIYDRELAEAYRKLFAYSSKKLEHHPVAMELFAECFRNLDRYFR
jgi:hypothetical protein